MYIAATKHILTKTPFNNDFLKYITCVNPVNILNDGVNADTRKHYILNICDYLPFQIDKDDITNEWELLENDIAVKKIPYSNDTRVDAFWSKVFAIKLPNNEVKYKHLSVVIKSCLLLTHGNADLERGFSTSARVLSKDKASMLEITLSSRLQVKSAIKMYGGNIENIPITDELLFMAKVAYQKYNDYLKEVADKKILEENEEKKREESLRKQEEIKNTLSSGEKYIEDYTKRLRSLESEYLISKEVASKLIETGNNKLKKAIKTSNMGEIALAQSMIESGKEKMKEDLKKTDEMSTLKRKIEKKKDHLLNILSKKKKTDSDK